MRAGARTDARCALLDRGIEQVGQFRRSCRRMWPRSLGARRPCGILAFLRLVGRFRHYSEYGASPRAREAGPDRRLLVLSAYSACANAVLTTRITQDHAVASGPV